MVAPPVVTSTFFEIVVVDVALLLLFPIFQIKQSEGEENKKQCGQLEKSPIITTNQVQHKQ